ncbi:MAG: helix-turn-helix transcriptional regulator [Pseudonocardia sp.]|nr:helix-turn-helix transcriptional regulator [Pseudonocardia sp.]
MNRRLAAVLTTMAKQPEREMTALEICRRSGRLPPGGIYDVLMKSERFGWVASRWADEETPPRNRLYRLTPDGVRRAAQLNKPQ